MSYRNNLLFTLIVTIGNHTMKAYISFFLASISIIFCTDSHAAKEELIIEPLTLLDKSYLERHREFVDDIGRREFGTRVRGDKSDLTLLKRILEAGLVNQTEEQKFHSLGVVLGDVFVSELQLEWKNYTDQYGKSHAACIPGKDQCLFPVTMISKRGVLGVTPDVIKLYNRGVELISDELPKLPYSVKKPKPREPREPRRYRLNTVK